jgi:hypothetical protein
MFLNLPTDIAAVEGRRGRRTQALRLVEMENVRQQGAEARVFTFEG